MVAADQTRVLLLLSSPHDPMVVERRSALMMLDIESKSARVLGEFPGAAQLVVWAISDAGLDDRWHALVASPGGVLWECLSDGTLRTHLDKFDTNGPDIFGHLTCSTTQDDRVLVGGMSNQLYQFHKGSIDLVRLDSGILDQTMEDLDSAIYSIATLDKSTFAAVGGGGSIFLGSVNGLKQLESGTNAMLMGACSLGPREFLACGAGGVKAMGHLDGWVEIQADPLGDLFLSSVAHAAQSIYWVGGRKLFVTHRSDPLGDLQLVEDAPPVHRLAEGQESIWTIGPTAIGVCARGIEWKWLAVADIEVKVQGGSEQR